MQQLGATEDSGNCCDITMCSLESITGHGLQAELAQVKESSSFPSWVTDTISGPRRVEIKVVSQGEC